MKAIAPHLQIHWLNESDGEPLLADSDPIPARRTAIPTPDGTTQGWLELLDLPLGMKVCRVVHRFAPGQAGLQPMSVVMAELSEPILFVQTTRTGRGVLHDRQLGIRLPHDPGMGIFQHLDRIDHQHWAEMSAPIEVTALSIGESAIIQMLGEPLAHTLWDALELGHRQSARIHPLPPLLSAGLYSACSAPHLTGSLRTLHAQARVLDFLVGLACHVTNKTTLKAPKGSIQQLREELDRLAGKIPHLDELAVRYGLSVRVMSALFKRETGQTLYAYLIDLRLNAAHVALQSGETALKVLAARLEFSDVSHFSNAFTKKFGYRPGQLQRDLSRNRD